VNETEVGKAIVYKNDIGETQLCIGTNVPPKCECEQSKVDGTAFGTKFPDTCGAADKCTGTKHTAVYKYVTRNATDEESTFAEWGKGLWNYVSVPGWFGIFAGTKNCFVRCEYKVFSAETGTAMNNGNSEFRYGGKFSIKSGKSCDHEAHDYLACAGDWSHRLNNKTKEFYTRDGANLYNGPVPAGMKKAINENYTVRREECGNPWDNTYGWTTWSREHAEDDIPYFCGSPLNEEAMFVELKF
jgi:hypothetical protein